MKRLILIVVLAVAVQLTAGQNLFADSGDVSLDFVAAAPFTYNHQTGGGAYNDGSVGVYKDIVETLEGADFKCGDIVTFLVQVRVNSAAVNVQTVTMNFTFSAATTGQTGAAHIDVLQVTQNGNGQLVENGGGGGRGTFGLDTGNVQNPGCPVSATITSKILPPQFFVKGASINLTGTVSGLCPGEKIVVRIDTRLGCNGAPPTGNLLATINWASDNNGNPINVGNQTIPLMVEGLAR